MSRVTISLSEELDVQVERRLGADGFPSKEDYVLELVRADCARAGLEATLEARFDGPFAPLESDWKQRVRDFAQRGE